MRARAGRHEPSRISPAPLWREERACSTRYFAYVSYKVYLPLWISHEAARRGLCMHTRASMSCGPRRGMWKSWGFYGHDIIKKTQQKCRQFCEQGSIIEIDLWLMMFLRLCNILLAEFRAEFMVGYKQAQRITEESWQLAVEVWEI